MCLPLVEEDRNGGKDEHCKEVDETANSQGTEAKKTIPYERHRTYTITTKNPVQEHVPTNIAVYKAREVVAFLNYFHMTLKQVGCFWREAFFRDLLKEWLSSCHPVVKLHYN